MNKRIVELERRTTETTIELTIDLDGDGTSVIETGIGFLDHLVTTLARHARFDLRLNCQGDLEVDDHHTTEDCALLIGSALDQVLGDRKGITRFGTAYAPLDEAMARAVVDLSGRPAPVVELGLERERIGALACENISHFISSLAVTARAAIHVDVLRGANDHHRAEAAFKALALALREAITMDGSERIPSTKEVL